VRAWRIEQNQHIPTATTGEGARILGGRWNSPLRPMVYASTLLSLSVLEILVHAKTSAQRKSPRSKVALDIPDRLIEVLPDGKLPRDFSPHTPFEVSQKLGDTWMAEGRTPVLVVPSAIIPEEHCVLLNPLHPAYRECKWGKFASIELDTRLWSV
jgi:RES domain-containing protein